MLCLLGYGETLAAAGTDGWDLTPLEKAPHWESLDPFQGTVTLKDFQEVLERVFLSSPEDAKTLIQLFPGHALIARQSRRPESTFRLQFGKAPPPPASWRPASQLPPLSNPAKPLEGLRIAIDPGHLGGAWARMEHRWFQIPSPAPAPTDSTAKALPPNSPVMEGEIVLRVAELLEEKLTSLGARVALVRRRLQPVTALRPTDLLDSVRQTLGLPPESSPDTHRSLQWESERLFYLSAEIRARAERINQEFRPDLALCLHVNAEPWGNPSRPALVDRNHFHILINGCFSRSELLKDDQRFLLLHRLLQRTPAEELALAEAVAASMGPKLGLPAYEYRGTQAKRPGASPYVWSRNLLATRIYHCPVVYFEPYVMNHQLTHARIQAGEYPGTRSILGGQYPNLFEEYASAVAEGVASYYAQRRQPVPAP